MLHGVSTDSRSVRRGDLFVALAGEHADGHDHVAQALAAGASAALVERVPPGVAAEAVLQVPSTVAALGRLAAWWRERIDPEVIAITGSNGKTTVKEMVAWVLAADARARGVDPQVELLATRGNFNNHLGLPLTLLRLRAGHRRAVVELGMNHAGELHALSALARPRVALVNNVQRAHVGLLGSLEAVARAKAEIFDGLGANGVAVINADDPHAALLAAAAGRHRVVRFSSQAIADVGPLLEDSPRTGAQVLRLRVGPRELACRLPLLGAHNAANLLATIATVLPLGIDPDLACAALEDFGGVPGRLRVHTLAGGAVLIDDSYNANPDSVLAAIAVLAARPGRRVLVLGDLGELGDGAPAMLAELGAAARAAGIESLIGLGRLVAAAADGFGAGARVSEDPATVSGWVRPLLQTGTTVLVKGSRFMRMERIVQDLSS
ncbi:MAG: UDP-N-acetylmuramoyl-tripeptide--D-alanyl-D-alanine ligase [Pseudomonadota bacterium]|nr:UDP-N-acetylmuramoyl-tripeptide--D-alanyl-D-alanine ligase [Pseudomonadota bacterium]